MSYGPKTIPSTKHSNIQVLCSLQIPYTPDKFTLYVQKISLMAQEIIVCGSFHSCCSVKHLSSHHFAGVPLSYMTYINISAHITVNVVLIFKYKLTTSTMSHIKYVYIHICTCA